MLIHKEKQIIVNSSESKTTCTEVRVRELSYFLQVLSLSTIFRCYIAIFLFWAFFSTTIKFQTIIQNVLTSLVTSKILYILM